MAYLKEALKNLLTKTFSIREGEYRTAILMQLNIFLLIATLLIVKPSINALFLARFGAERLPEAFIMVAITALIVSTAYARLLAQVKLNHVIERTLLVSFITLIGFLILLRVNIFEGWVLYLFYIWVAIFAVLSTSQFWILANLVYNVREAKRLFGFIGAGAIAGGIFGGYLTNFLAPAIGSENVIFVAASFLLVCIPITRLIWQENVSSLTVYRRKRRIREYEENPLQMILRSRHLSYLAAIIGISVIAAKLVDFQFSDIAHRAITDPDELAAFFGFWFSNINLLSLAIQLFFTARVVGVWGVGTSLFFLPVAILLGAMILFVFPELWAAILIKTADGSFKQSINKSATELLGLPIPFEIKSKTKTFIDVVVDSTATGIAGFILIFIVTGMGLSSRFVSAVIVLLIAIWIYLINQAKKEYIKSFKLQVKGVSESPDAIYNPASHQSILQDMEEVLKNGSANQICYMLGKAREIPNDNLFQSIKNLITHPSGAVREEAVRTLYNFQQKHLVDEIKPLIYDSNYNVKRAAFEYLFEHSSGDAAVLPEAYLDHADRDIADAALESLANEIRDNETLKQQYRLEDRIQKRIEAIEANPNSKTRKEDKLRLLDILGLANLPDFNHFLKEALNDSDREVVEKAIDSAGNSLNPDYIESLIDFLADNKLQESARKALVKYGQPVIDPLMEAVEERSATISALREVPSVIGMFRSQKAVNALFKLLDHEDSKLRLEAVRSLNNLKSSCPELSFNKKEVAKRILKEGKLYLNTLSALHTQIIMAYKKQKKETAPEKESLQEARRNLIELLEKRLDSDLERIFGLLGLKYPPGDIVHALEGIRSDKPEQRINAIEYLDNLLEPDLKRILIPIVETTILDSISEEALHSLNLEIPGEKECFEMLLAGRDRRIKLAVLLLIKELGRDKYQGLVEPYIDSEDSIIKKFAHDAMISSSGGQ